MIDASFLFNLDDGPCLDKLAVGQQLSLWLENCSTVNGVNSLGLLEDERQFHLKMCRLARKTQNLRLADRQLKLFVSKQQQQQQMQQRQRTYTNGLLLQVS
ncbi:unnamed protein product [Anisakis simplex]|uniref:F-box only protein 32 n=1 Tax=Anisakis simplex TaxID=6269 RepID=A0A0M3JH86_ANISI|nr:unnamed protein product [Anisakis simplex]